MPGLQAQRLCALANRPVDSDSARPRDPAAVLAGTDVAILQPVRSRYPRPPCDPRQDLSSAHRARCALDLRPCYSLESTAARINSKSRRSIGASTIEVWLRQHKPLMNYLRLRDRGRHLFPPEQTIRAIKLYHRQVYRYSFHWPKLECCACKLPRSGAVDLSARLVPCRGSRPCFTGAACLRRCHPRDRESQGERRDLHRRSHHSRGRQQQAAARDAAKNSCFINDSVTVAIEIPIWLREADIRRAGAAARCRTRAASGCGGAKDHRTHRLPASPQRVRAYPRLQT